MSFLGLGSFGEGFVKGFAESANEALKRDIERINNRIDKVAEIRTQRALDDQARRRDKVDATIERLKQGAKVIGGPNADAYAAGLLEEYGTAGYDALLTTLQDAKIKNKGIDIGSFFERAGVDAPGQAGGQTYTLRDYAEAYLGAPKTLPTSLKIPADDTRAGGLIGSVLGVDVDIAGRAQQRSAAEIAAMGTSDRYDASIVIPRITFDKFEFDLEVLPFEQRLQRIEEELTTATVNDPSPKPDFENRQEYLRALRDSTYTAYIENAGDLKKLELLTARRDTTKDSSVAANLSIEINTLSDKLRRQQFEAEGNDLAIMKLDAAEAWKNGDMDTFEQIMLDIQFRTTGKEETLTEKISRLGSKLDGMQEGTKPYNELKAEIDRLKKHNLVLVFEGASAELARLTSEAAGMDRTSARYKEIEKRVKELRAQTTLFSSLTESEFSSASKVLDDAIDREVELKLGAIGSLYVSASKLVATGQIAVEDLSVDLKNAYNQGRAMRSGLEQEVYDRMMGVLDPEDVPGLVAVGIYRGYRTNPADGTGTEGSTATSQTEAALDAGTGSTTPSLTVQNAAGAVTIPGSVIDSINENPAYQDRDVTEILSKMVKKYQPNNPGSGPALAMTAFTQNRDKNLDEITDDFNQIFSDLQSTGLYSEEWLQAARSEFEKKSKVYRAADILDEKFGGFAGALGRNQRVSAISEGLGIDEVEASALLSDAEFEQMRRREYERNKKEEERPLRPDQLLANIRDAANQEEYDAAVAAYIEAVPSRTEEDVKKNVPPRFNKGGLMARKAG